MTIKGKILICFLGALPLFGYSQNLIPNPSFEIISTCNVSNLQQGLNAVSDWSTYDYTDNSPDVFNDCFTFSAIQLPNSAFGYSFAQSGTGCAGIGANPLTNDYREVLSNQLTQSLMQDSAYCVSFFVKNSKADNEEYYSANLGLLFSNGITNHNEVRQQNADIIPFSPITGNNWTEVSGYYIASGGEQYVHIGFFGQPHTYTLPSGSTGIIYYYIDDVSVIPCNKDSLLNIKLDLPNVFTPNGDGDNDFMTIKQHNIKTMTVTVLNRWGEQIVQYDGTTTQWDGNDSKGENVSDGVYFIHVTAETNFGEMLNKQQFLQIFRKNN